MFLWVLTRLTAWLYCSHTERADTVSDAGADRWVRHSGGAGTGVSHAGSGAAITRVRALRSVVQQTRRRGKRLRFFQDARVLRDDGATAGELELSQVTDHEHTIKNKVLSFSGGQGCYSWFFPSIRFFKVVRFLKTFLHLLVDNLFYNF